MSDEENVSDLETTGDILLTSSISKSMITDQQPDQAFDIMEQQYFRELIKIPRNKIVYEKDIALNAHPFNKAMYLVSKGRSQLDTNQYKPEDFLEDDTFPESRRLKKSYRSFNKDEIESFASTGLITSKEIEHVNNDEQASKLWLRIVCVKQSGPVCQLQEIAQQKIDPKAMVFYDKTVGLKRIIHVSNFSPYWCYFVDENGAISIYVGKQFQKAQKYAVDKQVSAHIRAVLEDSKTKTKDHGWEMDDKEVFYDVRNFQIGLFAEKLTLIISNLSQKSDQIQVCQLQEEEFKHTMSMTGMFLDQVDEQGNLIIFQDHFIKHVSLSNESTQSFAVELIKNDEQKYNQGFTTRDTNFVIIDLGFMYLLKKKGNSYHRIGINDTDQAKWNHHRKTKSMIEYDGQAILIEKDCRNWFAFESTVDCVWKAGICATEGHYSSCPLPISHQAAIFAYKKFEQEFFDFKILEKSRQYSLPDSRPSIAQSFTEILDPFLFDVQLNEISIYQVDKDYMQITQSDDNLTLIAPVGSFSDRKQQITNKYTQEPEFEVFIKCKNVLYLASILMKDNQPAIQKTIKVTDQSLLDLFENDKLLVANRLGENSDQAFALIFLNQGLITTDLRQECQMLFTGSAKATLEPTFVPLGKSETRQQVLFMVVDPDLRDSRVLLIDKLDRTKSTKPSTVYQFKGELVQFTSNQNRVFILTLDPSGDAVIHLLEYSSDILIQQPKKVLNIDDDSLRLSLRGNKCIFNEKWFTCANQWFALGEDMAMPIYSPDKDTDIVVNAFPFENSFNFMKMLHISNNYITIQGQLHSTMAMSKPIDIQCCINDAFYILKFVGPDIFSYQWHAGHFQRRSSRLKIIDHDNYKPFDIHHPALGTDQTTVFYYRNDDRSYNLSHLRFDKEKADQITVVDHKDKKLNPDKYFGDTNRFWKTETREWPPIKQKWLLINDKEYHTIVFRSSKTQSDMFYQSVEKQGDLHFKQWCLPLDKEHGLDQLNKWKYVRQTENLIIFPIKKKIIIYRKSDITADIKDANEIKPIVLKGYKYLYAEGNTIEINYDKGRVLYDANTKQFLEYYELQNDSKSFFDSLKYPYFNRYSNQKFLDINSQECLFVIEPLIGLQEDDLSHEQQTVQVMKKFFSFIDFSKAKTLYQAPINTQAQIIIDIFDKEALVMTYGNNMSFFKLFKKYFNVIKTVNQLITGTCTSIQFESKRITDFQDIDGNKLSHALNRKGFCNKTLFGELINSFPVFEKLIELLNLSSGIPINFDMELLFGFFVDNQSNGVLDFFDNSFIENSLTRNVTAKYWPIDELELVFAHNKPFLNNDEIQAELDKLRDNDFKEEDAIKVDVVFKRLNITLKYYLTILTVLAEIDDKCKEEILRKSQIKAIIDFLWYKYFRNQIKQQIFLKYIYLLAVITVQYFYLLSNEGIDEILFWSLKSVLAIINLALQGHFIMIEKRQFDRGSLSDYFQFWNLVNVFQISLNLATVLSSFFILGELDGLYTIASISMFASCLNLFYIIRIYDNLAWFIILLQKTIKDLDSIIIVFFMCLLTFGTTSVMLQKSRSDESQPLVTDAVGFSIIDALITSYLVGLGDFATQFQGNNQVLCWLVFLLSTGVTLIIFMNMLIAQMGDTFDECQEKRDVITYQSRVSLIQEFLYLVGDNNELENAQYIYVIEQKQAEGMESRSWEGKLVQMQKIFEREIKRARQQMNINQKETRSLMKQLNEKTDEMKNKSMQDSDSLDQTIQDQVSSLKNQNDQKFDQLISMIQSIAEKQ